MSLVCVVTGCSEPHGFGRLIAEELHRRGHTVIGTVRDVAGRHREVARELGRTIEVAELDVTDDAGAQALMANVIERNGHIDALVNNAANVRHGALEDTSIESLRAVLDVNVLGPHRLVHAALPGMRQRRSGVIVQMSSINGFSTAPLFGSYSASKHALEAYSEALAYEVGRFGVRVVIVEPGAFLTGLHDRSAWEPGSDRGPYAPLKRQAWDEPYDAWVAGMEDPMIVARAVADAIENPDAPLHVPLGSDAVRRRRELRTTARRAQRSVTYVYPEIEPHQQGMLEVGDGNRVYWEACGNPDGRPAVVVHGGPGSGCSTWQRRLFDPTAYRIVLFDQRGCGRSTPHASEPDIDLASNTTQHLVADMELLRHHLEVDRWLVLGGSWGSALALAYAEAYPGRVTEMVLWGVTTGRRVECDWLFRGGVAMLFPEQWESLRAEVPDADRDNDIVEAYSRMLHDPDPDIRRRAALAWCTWESVTPAWPPGDGLDERYEDPDFALAFARLVTHYVSHDLFLEEGSLLRNAHVLADIPGILVNGRFDLQAPIANAWELKRVWPRAELGIVEDAGHAGDHPALAEELVRATDRFAVLG